MIYIVLGMHKSGTTLASQILHHSGVNMGDNIDAHISYDGGNKYERASTLALDMEILGVKDFIATDLVAPDTLEMTKAQHTRMQEIIQNCNKAYDNWGFKDPRACLVYPLWASELPEHKIIAIYRSPDEIWLRYRYNGWRYFYTNPLRAWKLINRWVEHNINILNYLQSTEMDSLVLSYRELVTAQAEFDRLQKFVGFELEDRRRANLYRNRPQVYPLLKIAIWLVHKRTGYTPEKIIEQFEALRQK